MYERHSCTPVDCPNGDAKPATCGVEGHADEKCTVCEFLYEYKTPATGQHIWSQDYKSDGTQHWKYCTVCKTEQDKLQHTWKTEREEPTCKTQGYERTFCEECGKIQKNTPLPITEHSYEYDESTRRQPTCTSKGTVTKRCVVCGDEQEELLDKLPHTWGELQFDGSGHWKTCSVCQTADRGNHNIVSERSNATCASEGYVDERCTYCGYTNHIVLPKTTNHQYVYVEGSEVPSTCTERGYYYNMCSVCGDRVRVESELAPHDLKYFPEQKRTETQDGWRNYWLCNVCGKYFSSKDCHEELTEEQVFDRNPSVVVTESVEQLFEYALNFKEEQSSDYYQVTATLVEADLGEGLLLLGDENGDHLFWAYFADVGDLYDLKTGSVITVKGFVKTESDDVSLYECKLVFMEHTDPDIVSLYVTVTGDYPHAMLSAESETGESFWILSYGVIQLTFPDSLLIGEKLTFSWEDYQGGHIKRAVINGQSVTFVNGKYETTVNGDIFAEFEFTVSEYVNTKITITQVDTNHGNPTAVDPYLSYIYTGSFNSYGRLYAKSYLRFTLTNAYITRVEIEYEDYNSDRLSQNTVSVGTDEAHKAQISNGYGNLKTVLTFDKADKYRFFEYHALSQARVKSITIHYETYNT